MKHLISLKNLSRNEILEILNFAKDVKSNYKKGIEFKPLQDKTIITSFPSTSLRTRVSFETGIYQLGGNSINMEIDFENKEPLEDKVGYLNNWIDYLVLRHPKQNIIERVAVNADFSVINAMSKQSHPCEILSDIMTLAELKGNLRDLKIVFAGEGANISNTWFEAAAKLDLNITQVCPKGYEINNELYEYAKKESNGEIIITNDIDEALKSADIILTDGWPVCEDNPEEFSRFMPYQIDISKISLANKDCIVNPCPPFKRGYEISAQLIDSKYFAGYGAKENLLHMQKTILAYLKR